MKIRHWRMKSQGVQVNKTKKVECKALTLREKSITQKIFVFRNEEVLLVVNLVEFKHGRRYQ